VAIAGSSVGIEVFERLGLTATLAALHPSRIRKGCDNYG
jgi:hypothetical protein